jgi:RNA polymerase sigma-70 factor (ECF subfamily)
MPGQWVAPSWERIVEEHAERVYRLALRLSGNQQDAEDLTQETFVRVFRSLDRYEPGTFEGWLHRITTNLFLDLARRRQRIRFVPLPDDAERVAGTGLGPEALVLAARMPADVEEALAALPKDFRDAVWLADIEQMSYEEIARALDVKVGTVRSRIHRGRTQLRTALAARAPRPAEPGRPGRRRRAPEPLPGR